MKRSLCIVAFLLLSLSCFAQEEDAMKTFDANFVHTVFFWLNNPDDDADRNAFETSLKKFLNTSKYAKTDFIGTPPEATRDVVDGSFTYKLVVTFESAEAQENYQNEEAHLLFIEECKDLWKKVIVYDAQELK